MKRTLVVAALAGLLLAAAIEAQVAARSEAAALPAFARVQVAEIVLSNGFRLLVVEDHRAPRVAASLWYRVGALTEGAGEHGSTHFLEHVVHQGTTTIGTTDFEAEKPLLKEIHEVEAQLLAAMDRQRNELHQRQVYYDDLRWPTTPEIERLRTRLYELEDRDSRYRDFWAELNWYRRYGYLGRHTDPVPATTGYEQLEIDVDLPQENIELFFRIEADRMANAVLRGWEAQRYTVLEQLRGTLNRPDGRFYFALDGIKGWGHPWDFQYFNRAAMLRVYDQYFVPGNATLVLVGDITAEQARPFAEKYFGAIPAAAAAPRTMDVEAEPSPRGARRLDWQEPVDPRVVLRYGIPGVGHPDRPAFEAIVALLRGRHGLIGERLAGPQGPAASVQADVRLINMYRTGSVGALNIVLRGRRDEDVPLIEAGALRVIEQLRTTPVDAAALARARRAMRLEWEQTRSVRGTLAYALGRFEVMHDWRTLQPFMEAREQVSAADIQRVAARYLVGANRLVGTARSQPLEPAAAPTASATNEVTP